MAPLSGCPALHIGPLFKYRRNKCFSHYIYGFAIYRIYKKLYNMYISVCRWGSRSSRNYFSNVKTKAVASDSRKKKQCAMPSMVAAFVAAKRSFSRRFAWSRRNKLSYLRNFDQSWSFLAIFLTLATCRWSNLRKPTSVAEPPPLALVAILET